jgi:methylmalonyl-CoA mutase
VILAHGVLVIQPSENSPKISPNPSVGAIQNSDKTYHPRHKVRFVTATSLFDGHDASINIMRRLLQARGAEVVHLGHNRSAAEVVAAALQEDAQAVALSSYQGGHMEYFTYIRELLDQAGAKEVKIFGGGGGVISPAEIRELESKGISKIYTPEDGQGFGLEGIIGHMLRISDFVHQSAISGKPPRIYRLARVLTQLESGSMDAQAAILAMKDLSGAQKKTTTPVIGITGTGGAGKSSLTDEILTRFLFDFPQIRIGVICIDPSKKKTGGALLGDRIRFNSAVDDRLFLRSFASRDSGNELAKVAAPALALLKTMDFDFVILETSGIGQAGSAVLELADISLYVTTPEYGAASQLEKIDMLDFADMIAVNKFERPQGPDALRDIRTVLRRGRFKGVEQAHYPVFGTIASRFNDDGVNGLYELLCAKLRDSCGKTELVPASTRRYSVASSNRDALIPSRRNGYLAEVANAVRSYHKNVHTIVQQVSSYEALTHCQEHLGSALDAGARDVLKAKTSEAWAAIPLALRGELENWDQIRADYAKDEFSYTVRGQEVKIESGFRSLSHLLLPKVALPTTRSKAEIARFLLLENRPGSFPFTGGLFPFRRQGEDPKRQFAGEGGPARTNTRFHFLSADDPSKRLSTAFDSVTLYGADPDRRPDIYGKVGESGVSIAHLDDMKVLYSGFDLISPSTSVSMTINGPAPIILAMFLNTAIDQQVDIFIKKNGRAPNPTEHQQLYDQTLQSVRGTVQADILKEDQAQNTCIFSTEFALKMMGDIQQYFVEKSVRNYYSVSISGYHIAEAGANPITQTAFTLANGFTYVEYYLARGLKIDDFAPNLSFFFSNGLDPEYAVIGRVARRIWAIAIRDIYGGSERSQKLKYHIQTSGRSLHAQEMDFNDIRTTLQAYMALIDNCNSLHTNSYDEALTTPTEESVRRAMAIQLIINKELGSNKCENLNQGSHFLEALTDSVEEAVLAEFERISSRGGVLGAMETQYQRSKIQEESLYYEQLKHDGTLPIIGVNTYINPDKGQAELRGSAALTRSSYDEKDQQLQRLESFRQAQGDKRQAALEQLSQVVLQGGNVFAELMHTVRHASLGEIAETLYRVGGRYRRSM